MGFKGRLVVFGYPLVEILLLWGVASLIGWGWALLGLLAGIPIGLALMRNAGSTAATMMRQANTDPEAAAAAAGSSVGQFFAGLLFLVPGYFTDLLGAGLLIPGVRSLVGRRLSTSVENRQWMSKMPGFPGSGEIIQGTVVIEDLRYEQDPDEETGRGSPREIPPGN